MSKDYKMDIEVKEARVDYNPDIIQVFAQKLYSKADSIEALYAIIGLVVGLALFASFGASRGTADVTVIMSIAGAILGVYIGKQIGISRSIQYRIEAQKALCFVQIEKNTRPS